MFATMEATRDDDETLELEPRRSSKRATEEWCDAQDLDNAANVTLRGWPRVRTAQQRIQSWPKFFVLWQVIGIVSAYDAFLAMKFQAELPFMERNHLGRFLLTVEDGDPALFLATKFLGTMMVLGILANLYHTRPRWGMTVAWGVASFQVGLLAFLTLG